MKLVQGPWVPVGGRTLARHVIEVREYQWREIALPVPVRIYDLPSEGPSLAEFLAEQVSKP